MQAVEGRQGFSRAGLWAGPLAGLFILVFIQADASNPQVSRTLAVAVFMAIWWITEAVPLAVTALLPVVLFPVLGIMSGKKVAPMYFNHIIFLFIGGFMVALAMQRWNLHKRIALRILILFGGKPRNIMLGFMIATAFLSLWISNTATTMMMVPIVMAVLFELERGNEGKPLGRYAPGLLIAVAYSASIGGIGTLVGTPPNMSFARIWTITFPDAPPIDFARWMAFALPISLIFLAFVWVYLTVVFPVDRKKLVLDAEVLKRQYQALGAISFEETIVLVDFILLALLWLTRNGISFGTFSIPGWSSLFGHPKYLNDGVVAIAMAVLLFLVPARSGKDSRVLTWKTVEKLPWDIVLLFGGGFALAGGFKESGLSAWTGQQLSGLSGVHPLIIIATICLVTTFLTELTSNTATAQILLPILAAMAQSLHIHPLLLMIPGTLSCSFAFMLPVATPPNAIVFGAGRIRIHDMVKAGLVLNLAGVVLVTLMTWFWGAWIFDLHLTPVP